jgi:3',5'-cyclic AMP phosphodiesterase CpdA
MKKKYFMLLVSFILLSSCSAVSEQINNSIFIDKTTPIPTINAEKTYAFAVLGDNRPDSVKLNYFLRMINQLNIQTSFHVGDLVQFSSPIFYLSVLEAIDQSYKNKEFIAVVGNHDVEGSSGNTLTNLGLFNHFFSINEPHAYRYKQKNNMHFIMLNSYLPGYENEISPEQLSWLNSTLESIPENNFIFVFLHHPPYPAGYHIPLLNRDALHSILTQYPISAVFSGHEHLYYKQVVDGIPYYVSGGAGSTLHSTENGISSYHFLAISITPNLSIDAFNSKGEIIND